MEINGKKVTDSKKHLNIKVTKDDCIKGATKDPANCAAAKAIVREVPGAVGARVHRGITYVEYPKHWERFITPTSLKTELTIFDRHKVFVPGPHTLGCTANSAQSLPALRQRWKAKTSEGTEKVTGSGYRDPKRPKRTRNEIPNIRPRGANR